MVFLICFGLVMLYSASAYAAQVDYGDSMYYFKRQILFCLAGALGAYLVSLIDYHIWSRLAKKIFFLSLIVMALVQTPLGKEVNGARRWIKLPLGQQLQPSELAKIAVILFIPVVICQVGKQIGTLAGIVRVLCWGALSAACVFFLTENLSTAIIVFGISFLMVFIVHPKKAMFIVPVVAGVAAVLLIPVILGPSWRLGIFPGTSAWEDCSCGWIRSGTPPVSATRWCRGSTRWAPAASLERGWEIVPRSSLSLRCRTI